MIHRIRTAFGDSEISYGGDDLDIWEFSPQGVLQGNASGPAIWTTVRSLILTLFCSALSKEFFLLVGFAYMDDTT